METEYVPGTPKAEAHGQNLDWIETSVLQRSVSLLQRYVMVGLGALSAKLCLSPQSAWNVGMHSEGELTDYIKVEQVGCLNFLSYTRLVQVETSQFSTCLV